MKAAVLLGIVTVLAFLALITVAVYLTGSGGHSQPVYVPYRQIQVPAGRPAVHEEPPPEEPHPVTVGGER